MHQPHLSSRGCYLLRCQSRLSLHSLSLSTDAVCSSHKQMTERPDDGWKQASTAQFKDKPGTIYQSSAAGSVQIFMQLIVLLQYSMYSIISTQSHENLHACSINQGYMEAHFCHWIKNTKGPIIDLCHSSDFISLELWVYILQFWLHITQLRLYTLQLRVYEKKSQNCEVKVRNDLFCFYSVAETSFHSNGKISWMLKVLYFTINTNKEPLFLSV